MAPAGAAARNGGRRRRAPAALLALSIITAAPYALLGPGWLREDWGFLLSARDGGRLGGWFWPFRPLAAAIHVVLFDGIGPHPLVVYAVQTAVVAGVALALWSTLRKVTSEGVAFGAAALWLVLPTHSALDHWASGLYIAVALLFAVLGARREASGRSGLAWFVAAGLTYEAVLVPVLLLLAWRRRWVPLAVSVGVCAWATLLSPIESTIRVVPPRTVLTAVFGLGLGRVAAVVVLVALALAWRDRMVRLGVGLAVAGVIPFVPYGIDITFAGVGDRAMVTASIGIAIAMAALAHRRPALAPTIVAALVASCLATSVTVDRDYATAVELNTENLRCATGLDSRRPIEVAPVSVDGVQGLVDWWDATPAVRYVTGDPDARADTSATVHSCAQGRP